MALGNKREVQLRTPNPFIKQYYNLLRSLLFFIWAGTKVFIGLFFVLSLLFAAFPPCAIAAIDNPSKETVQMEPLTLKFNQGLFSINAKDVSLGEVLNAIEKKSGFAISLDKSIKSTPITISFSNLDIVKTLRAITNAAGLGGYGISYKTNESGKIGQWVVDKVNLVGRGDDSELSEVVGSKVMQQAGNSGNEQVKRAKGIEKEPYFDKRLNRYVEVVKGEALVRFPGDFTKEKIEKFHIENRTKTIKGYEKINVHRLRIHDSETIQEFIEKHLIDSKQVYIEPVFLASQQAILVNDPSFKYQWSIPQIQADKAWEISSGSPDIIVAVIDTGIDIAHPDLKNNIITGIDIVNGNSNGIDDNGHGTYVGGIIPAEANNTIGIPGVAG